MQVNIWLVFVSAKRRIARRRFRCWLPLNVHFTHMLSTFPIRCHNYFYEVTRWVHHGARRSMFCRRWICFWYCQPAGHWQVIRLSNCDCSNYPRRSPYVEVRHIHIRLYSLNCKSHYMSITDIRQLCLWSIWALWASLAGVPVHGTVAAASTGLKFFAYFLQIASALRHFGPGTVQTYTLWSSGPQTLQVSK